MRCLVTGGNVKVIGKAVHSLSRIGDELYVEPTEDGLSLRAVNSSRSAYACFLFAPLFFQLYEEGSPDPDGETFRCKVLMKSFLGVFRSLPSLEKMVEKCLISLNPRASRLVVQLHCKYGECSAAGEPPSGAGGRDLGGPAGARRGVQGAPLAGLGREIREPSSGRGPGWSELGWRAGAEMGARWAEGALQ
ncbi:Cell cycle checkpoint control protein RAD9A [Platysternon megacephalum]|uniref:Cell cycle checkpoint control protein RAD9A n=1 Tax=Platysternon megacephalum TaxID=55544 RepID=A0A4D9DPY6_9SAUR|nr:Cell cycle checkpoint control protein RAD9A [Platysternon megacephalum]